VSNLALRLPDFTENSFSFTITSFAQVRFTPVCQSRSHITALGAMSFVTVESLCVVDRVGISIPVAQQAVVSAPNPDNKDTIGGGITNRILTQSSELY
jgi:hypothetical protein